MGAVKRGLEFANMPIVILFLTAVLGGLFAQCFQDRSFRKNTLFEAQLAQITAGRNESVRMFQDLDAELKRLSASEGEANRDPNYCQPKIFQPIIERLKSFNNRSIALEDYSRSVGESSAVGLAIQEFNDELARLLECQNKYLKPECTPCQGMHPKLRQSSRKIIGAHNTLIQELFKNN